jgi:hypothetical protein
MCSSISLTTDKNQDRKSNIHSEFCANTAVLIAVTIVTIHHLGLTVTTRTPLVARCSSTTTASELLDGSSGYEHTAWTTRQRWRRTRSKAQVLVFRDPDNIQLELIAASD